ncbi:hypothetical protein LJC08_01030 [Methanimicrococcus sp. OttesenSCG-928-J09]|nr:hypothetical protein [Methanimicrococcus sp. OttesenSCG-928-J09]
MGTFVDIFKAIFQDAFLFVTMFIIMLIVLLGILIFLNGSFEKDEKKQLLGAVFWTIASIITSVFMLKGSSNFENFNNNIFWYSMIAGIGLYSLFTSYAISDCYNYIIYYKNHRNDFKKTYSDRLIRVTSNLSLGMILFILFMSIFAFLFVLIFCLYILFFNGTDFLNENSDFGFDSYLGFITSIATVCYVIFTGITLYYLNKQIKAQADTLSKTTTQLENQKSDIKIKNINDKLKDTKEQIEEYYAPMLNYLLSYKMSFDGTVNALLILDEKEKEKNFSEDLKELKLISEEINLCLSKYMYEDPENIVIGFMSDVPELSTTEIMKLSVRRKDIMQNNKELKTMKNDVTDSINRINNKIDGYQNSLKKEIKERGKKINQLRKERDELIKNSEQE